MSGWMVGTCEVAKMPEYFVDAPMPAAQEKHSKPGPLKLVLPPKPRQRPIGTSASNSISSEILASSSVLGQLISNTRSMVEMAQPRSRLVPNVPSLSARSLNTGLVARRSSSMRLSAAMEEVLPSSDSLHGGGQWSKSRVPGALQHAVLLRRPGTPVDFGKPGSRICGAPLARCTACETRYGVSNPNNLAAVPPVTSGKSVSLMFATSRTEATGSGSPTE